MKMPSLEPSKEKRIADMVDFMGACVSSYDINRLDKMNFFTAPASTRFHGNYEGGKAVCLTIPSRLLKHWWNSAILTISCGREEKVRSLSECSTTCVRRIITFRTEPGIVGNAMTIVC